VIAVAPSQPIPGEKKMDSETLDRTKSIGTGLAFILYPICSAVGFLVQGIAVFRSRAVPRWQSGALIVSMLGMGVAAAADIDLFGLVATGVLAVGFVPMGWAMIVSVRRTDARDLEHSPIVEPA
jgi:hypothetical protein